MSSPIMPLGDRVVAVKKEAKTKTASGIFLPENAKEQPIMAEIVAVGDEVKSLKNGDKIVYSEYRATDLKINNKDYLIIKLEDILGIVK